MVVATVFHRFFSGLPAVRVLALSSRWLACRDAYHFAANFYMDNRLSQQFHSDFGALSRRRESRRWEYPPVFRQEVIGVTLQGRGAAFADYEGFRAVGQYTQALGLHRRT